MGHRSARSARSKATTATGSLEGFRKQNATHTSAYSARSSKATKQDEIKHWRRSLTYAGFDEEGPGGQFDIKCARGKHAHAIWVSAGNFLSGKNRLPGVEVQEWDECTGAGEDEQDPSEESPPQRTVARICLDWRKDPSKITNARLQEIASSLTTVCSTGKCTADQVIKPVLMNKDGESHEWWTDVEEQELQAQEDPKLTDIILTLDG